VTRLFPSRTRSAIAAVAVALVLLSGVSACSSATLIALSVNGSTLTRSDFLVVLKLAEPNTGTQQLVQYSGSPSGSNTTADAKELTEINPELAAAVLTFVVEQRLMVDELARRGLTTTQADRDAAVAEIEGQLAPGAFDGFGSLKPLAIEGFAAQKKLSEVLGGDADVAAEARAYYDEQVAKARAQDAASVQYCVSVIQFPFPNVTGGQQSPELPAAGPPPGSADDLATKQQALDVLAQVSAGTSFVDLVTSQNTRQQLKDTGATPVCVASDQLPPEFTALEVNAISEPYLLSGDGYYLFQLRSKEAGEATDIPEYETIKERLEQSFRTRAGAAKLGAVIAPLRASSTIHVDPLFGTWNATTGAVDPPAGATPAPTVPIPSTSLDLGSLGLDPGTLGPPPDADSTGTAGGSTAPGSDTPSTPPGSTRADTPGSTPSTPSGSTVAAPPT